MWLALYRNVTVRVMWIGPEVSRGWWKVSFELWLLNWLIHNPRICVTEAAVHSCCSCMVWFQVCACACACVCVCKIRRVWKLSFDNQRCTKVGSICLTLCNTFSWGSALFSEVCAAFLNNGVSSIKHVFWRDFVRGFRDPRQYELWKVKLVSCIRTGFWKTQVTAWLWKY
jgi:hypothetical protein